MCDPCKQPGTFALTFVPPATSGEGYATCKIDPDHGPWGLAVVEGIYQNIPSALLENGVTMQYVQPAPLDNVPFAWGTSTSLTMPASGAGSFVVQHYLRGPEDVQKFIGGGVLVSLESDDGFVQGTVCPLCCESTRKCIPPCKPKCCCCPCKYASGGSKYH